MTRIFPAEFTVAELARLRAIVDETVPFIQDGWASFDFDVPFDSFSVKLTYSEFDSVARRAAETAIAMLPHFQAWTIAVNDLLGRNDGSDDHSLYLVEIDGDEVALHYSDNNCNSNWDVSFFRGCAGLWYPDRKSPPLPEPPGPCKLIDPAWLRWNEGTVRKLVEAIRNDRTFDQMPILADALEESGCTDVEILAHCREPGDHGRGCWVLDLLGRED